MTEQQWADVNRIFDAAVALPPEGRGAYLATAFNGDAVVQRAVEELLQADLETASYLETPAAVLLGLEDTHNEAAAPLLSAGVVLSDRFLIRRLVGLGGMGQVYEAFDQELGVRVAIKVIRPEFARDSEAVRRFRHEVRLARSITHTNVCRTFDLERVSIPSRAGLDSTELLFLTMEFLEGETLAQHIARSGPIPADEALTIARQIAAALDAAHTKSVIHRDIKPQNIILERTEGAAAAALRVIVTDFGLARADPANGGVGSGDFSSTARPGMAAGTFAYMAPEQMEGHPVSAATDIYSFGLLLFEMVTGQRARSSAALLTGLLQPDSGGLRADPHTLVLPPAWRTPIARCLAVRPEDRFASAAQVVACLEAPPGLANVRWRPAAGLHRRWLLASVPIFLVALSLLLLVPRFRTTAGQSSTAAAGTLVYVPPTLNRTPISNLGSVTELMRTALTQSSHLNVLDEPRVAGALERMARSPDSSIDEAAAREIAMRTGAGRVVFTTLRQDAGLLYLDVDLQQTDNTPRRSRNEWRRSWTCCGNYEASSDAIPPDLLHIIRDASDWVRKLNGEAAADIVSLNAPVEEVTTMSWEALADFESAERLAQQDRHADALVALRNAIERDPEFALAYARMGDILFSLDRGAEGIEAYKHALEAGDQRRLTRRERDRLRGLYAIDTWDYAEAERIFQDSTVYYPQDFFAWFYRGSVLLKLNRLPEAADVLHHAELLQPGSASAFLTRGSVLFAMGDASGALRAAAALREAGHVPEALWLEAEGGYLAGDFAKADRALKAIDETGPGSFRSVSFAQRARVVMESGHPDDALKVLQEGIARDLADGNASAAAAKQMDRAYIECAAEKFRECIADERASLSRSASPQNVRLAAQGLGGALSLAAGSERSELRKELQSLLRQAPSPSFGMAAEIVRAQLEAELLLSDDRTEAAAEQFHKMAMLDDPADAPIGLAQALTWVAEKETDPQRRAKLLDEASNALRAAMQARAYLWYRCTWTAPGLHAELAVDAKWVERLRSAARGSGPPGKTPFSTSRAVN